MKIRSFWEWYDEQCHKPFVGLLMIPLTIMVCFSPMLAYCVIREAWSKHAAAQAEAHYRQLDRERAAIYAKGEDPDK
jgi:hypothetical protein